MESFARALPTAALVGVAWATAWHTHGSTNAPDWLPYALVAALVVGAVLLSGAAVLPTRSALLAIGAICAIAVWAFVSHWWSAAPSLARDEALLTAFYALALATPLLTLRTPTDRLVAVGLVALGSAALAMAAAADARWGAHPASLFVEGRLAFPISYINAQAATFLLGWWPAVGIAAHRRLHPLLRAAALGAAAIVGAAALLAQSKGAELGLALSALVVFAVSSGRLRLLVPAAIAAVLDAAAVAPLTAPYRADPARLAGAVRHAGDATIAVGVVALLLGLGYALADRRLDVSERTRRLAGRAVGGLLALAVVAAVASFLLLPRHPVGWVHAKWETFKTPPVAETESSHLLSLGSYRYDMWRVALHNWEKHPLAGIGARGFGPSYLVQRDIRRTPAHAHSLELESLSDQGLVGFALLVAAIGIPLVIAGSGARRRLLPAAVALGGGSYVVLHASADWLWSFPAVGVPFFVLLGIGASWGARGRLLSRRVAVACGVLCVALAVVAFLPVWLSAHLVRSAQSDPSASRRESDLRWARCLDPLATSVLVARAADATSYAEQVHALAKAVSMEPRQAPLRYLLGVVELNGGHGPAARRQLRRALALDPGDPIVEQALGLATQR